MFKSIDKVYLEEIAFPTYDNTLRILSEKTDIGASYDEIIQDRYKGDKEDLNKITGIEIPTTSGTFNITGDLNKKVFSELYDIAPPTKKDPLGMSKGSGNGELALYWFLKKTYPQTKDSRYIATGAADIMVGDTGIEVKAYPVSKKDIKIGKFKTAGKEEGKKNNIILNTIFGLNTLLNTSNIGEESLKEKISDTGNFDFTSLKNSFEKVNELTQFIEQNILMVSQFNVFKYIIKNLEDVYSYLGMKGTSEENSKQLSWRILRTKLLDKPGAGGFIVNISRDGTLQWIKIPDNLESINTYPDSMHNDAVYAWSGDLYMLKDTFK